MKFTFGIITDGQCPDRVLKVIDSIIDQNIPYQRHEIIVVGGQPMPNEPIRHIPFDENIKKSWITKKKNLITENAQFRNVVYLHDYVALMGDWYQGFLKFGNAWDICMTRMENPDGSRYRDWCAWDDPSYGSPWTCHEWWAGNREFKGQGRLVPYTYNKTQYMYISGAYFVAKKEVMQREPLNEEILWGQGEDVEWSLRVRNHYIYSMNTLSTVRLLKQKDVVIPSV